MNTIRIRRCECAECGLGAEFLGQRPVWLVETYVENGDWNQWRLHVYRERWTDARDAALELVGAKQ